MLTYSVDQASYALRILSTRNMPPNPLCRLFRWKQHWTKLLIFQFHVSLLSIMVIGRCLGPELHVLRNWSAVTIQSFGFNLALFWVGCTMYVSGNSTHSMHNLGASYMHDLRTQDLDRWVDRRNNINNNNTNIDKPLGWFLGSLILAPGLGWSLSCTPSYLFLYRIPPSLLILVALGEYRINKSCRDWNIIYYILYTIYYIGWPIFLICSTLPQILYS